MQKKDVIIVGGGPAGSAAALQLVAREPRLASRILLLDKAKFPRDKVCGGGVVRQADRYLSYLGAKIDVPAVPIHRLRFEHVGGRHDHLRANAFRVVRRIDFDQALLNEVKSRQVEVREGEGVVELRRVDGGVRVVTDLDEYEARIVLGADGAGSRVRRFLLPARPQHRFVALELVTPRTGAEILPAAQHMAVFDFRPAAHGLRGYYWDFPSPSEGAPQMNRGAGGSRWSRQSSLRHLFDCELARRQQPSSDDLIRGASIPMYDPGTPLGGPHVLLAGDAVGVDPWLAEGISIAIATGMLAAHAAADALTAGCFDFRDHHRRVRASAVGQQLRRNRILARRFYRQALSGEDLGLWFDERRAGEPSLVRHPLGSNAHNQVRRSEP